ncbi:MAG: arginine--tRNA ligase [Clostridia bacterium]|nr:arginine--tRNA ligase [Clostridia bacterium]
MNLKQEVYSVLEQLKDYGDLNGLLIESIDETKGDYCLPCFSLAKTLRKAPMIIADEIAKSLNIDNSNIEKVESVAGYVNFFLNKENVSKNVLNNFVVPKHNSNDKVVCIDYCSVNLAKYMHIGHLKNSFLGESLARLFEHFGYKVVRINYIGDYGTPYGKIIAGLQMWGTDEDVKTRGIDALQEYYVKFCAAEADDENLQQLARDLSKKIEDKDAEIYPIYQQIIEVARKEAERLLDILGIHFDSWKGEASYAEELNDVVKMLDEKGLLSISEGATIVDLSKFDMPPCLVKRSDGASIYASRDIAAAIDRYNTYKFDKMLYLTAVEQKLHFAQFFKVLELADMPFSSSLEHISYGRFSLPSGKISSRHGKQAVLVDLIDYVLDKAKDVIKNRTFSIEKPEDVAMKVAKGVLSFNAINIDRNKDAIFDIDRAFSFEGETAPYMQYTYTRIMSILRKAQGLELDSVEPDYSCLNQTQAFELIKSCCQLDNILSLAIDKRDPSVVLKYCMEMCKTLNKYYTVCKILDDNMAQVKAKLQLLTLVKDVLSTAFNLICIETVEEM